ncbi:hypothetical protein CLV24_104166 [Pontibacter ummariensis]|uniref:Uncharacterized protein n=1 Tax=Pontibacter ummariensis TaxID=1610492 RepID=A0A239DE57_9BACT|nr:hypothetical protein [Pontibacter ummariensis]PRY14356.1 hypothetical protein CLV24_104166 [Pontibacter ummariensis]SNS30003.1 hypothetical protein SAMN06296052_104165 [Pontibacter ummariensis]
MNTQVKEGFRVEIPTEKMVLQRDEREIARLEKNLPAVTAAFNKALAELEKLNVGEFSIEEVVSAINGNKPLERQVRERMATGPVTVQGMVFSLEKVREMIEIPNVIPANLALANIRKVIDGIISNAGQSLQYVLVVGNFEINGFTATFKQEAIERFVDHHSVYAETDEEKEAAIIFDEIFERVGYLSERYGLHVVSKSVIKQNDLTSELTKNPSVLKSHMVTLAKSKRR